MKKTLLLLLLPILGFSQNTILGTNAGSNAGVQNTYIGYESSYNLGGSSGRSKNGNSFLGHQAGKNHISEYSVFIGRQSGFNAVGDRNVLIGNEVGYSLNSNDKLYIDNSNTSEPLIWGDFAVNQLKFNGSVSISTQLTPTGYKLAVGGKIIAEELKIQLQNLPWPDYVFSSDYRLPTLEEVEKQIKEKGHLVNVPSACEIEEKGFEVGNMTTIQQEKIEELTLYIIEQNKINEKQSKEIEELKKTVKSLLEKK